MTLQLWEVLLPARLPLKLHRAWDEKVGLLCGGCTIIQQVDGVWKPNQSRQVRREKMLAVRVAVSLDKLDELLGMTAVHYDQTAIMAYKISDDVRFYTYE